MRIHNDIQSSSLTTSFLRAVKEGVPRGDRWWRSWWRVGIVVGKVGGSDGSGGDQSIGNFSGVV